MAIALQHRMPQAHNLRMDFDEPEAVAPKPPIQRPLPLAAGYLLGLAYIPTSFIDSLNLGSIMVVVVHVGMICLGAAHLRRAASSFDNTILTVAMKVQCYAAVLDGLVVMLVTVLRIRPHALFGCWGHMAICGPILVSGKVFQLVFLFENHYMLSQERHFHFLDGDEHGLARIWGETKARICNPAGVVGSLLFSIVVPSYFAMWLTVDFTPDCVYIGKDPYKNIYFISVTLLAAWVLLLYMYQGYISYQKQDSIHKVTTNRLLLVVAICLTPAWAADFYVVYFAYSFPLAACLNCCAWFLIMGILAMQYASDTIAPLGLQAATFLDESWAVIRTCEQHRALLHWKPTKGNFRDLVVDPDPRLEFLSKKAPNFLVLHVLPVGCSEMRCVLVRVAWMGNGMWSMQLQDISMYLKLTHAQQRQQCTILSCVDDPVMMIDENLQVSYANAAMTDMLGYHDESFIGIPLRHVAQDIQLPDDTSPPEWVATKFHSNHGTFINTMTATTKIQTGQDALYAVVARRANHSPSQRLIDQLNEKIGGTLEGMDVLLRDSLEGLEAHVSPKPRRSPARIDDGETVKKLRAGAGVFHVS